jgi:hypothetical protein
MSTKKARRARLEHHKGTTHIGVPVQRRHTLFLANQAILLQVPF